MRILFIGCVIFSKNILELLVESKFNVVGVISKDDTGFNSDYYDTSIIAKHYKIPFIKTKNVNELPILEWVSELKPDIVYCFGWNSLLGIDFIQIPKKGVVGYHPASLPQNRGRHPVIWALILGLTETASTFFFMGEGADDGDIVSQKKIIIEKEDTASTLYDKLIHESRTQVIEFTNQLINNQLIAKKQDHRLANSWRKRSKVDGVIDFRMSNESIYNLVRALTKPYPGALILYKGEEYPVWQAKIAETPYSNFEPGKVLKISESSILVKCGLSTEAILLENHELPETIQVGDYL